MILNTQKTARKPTKTKRNQNKRKLSRVVFTNWRVPIRRITRLEIFSAYQSKDHNWKNRNIFRNTATSTSLWNNQRYRIASPFSAENEQALKGRYFQIFVSYTVCVTIIVNTINLFKIHVSLHNSCELLGEFSILIPKYLLWVLKGNRAMNALLLARYVFVVIKPFWNSAKRQFESLVVGKFKSHPSSSDYLGLILWNCHNRPPLNTSSISKK